MLFTIKSIIVRVANNVSLLLVGRCVQGINGGGLIALTYIIIINLITLRE
jgi:predicted MFS family arabinose efflux permease